MLTPRKKLTTKSPGTMQHCIWVIHSGMCMYIVLCICLMWISFPLHKSYSCVWIIKYLRINIYLNKPPTMLRYVNTTVFLSSFPLSLWFFTLKSLTFAKVYLRLLCVYFRTHSIFSLRHLSIWSFRECVFKYIFLLVRSFISKIQFSVLARHGCTI